MAVPVEARIEAEDLLSGVVSHFLRHRGVAGAVGCGFGFGIHGMACV